MRKLIVSLVTAFASLLSWLGFSNPGMADSAVHIETTEIETISQSVSLNQTASLWQLSGQDTQEFFAHLGCSCGVCAQANKNTNDI